MSRIRAAVLAAASALLSVATTETHGIAIGITAGCSALVAAAAAWSSSEYKKKSSRILHRAENHSTLIQIKKNLFDSSNFL